MIVIRVIMIIGSVDMHACVYICVYMRVPTTIYGNLAWIISLDKTNKTDI